MSRIILLFTIVLILSDRSYTQLDNWYDADVIPNKLMSVSTDKAYNDIVPDDKPAPVIVAILDSGVDAEHEDLASVMWVNKDEIPNNGLDDDQNGYIDDINGWNFIGNANGDNVHGDNLEMTRLFAEYRKIFGDRESVVGLPKEQVEMYQQYIEWKQTIERERTNHGGKLAELQQQKGYLIQVMDSVSMRLDRDSVFQSDVDAFMMSGNQFLAVAAQIFNQIKMEYGGFPTMSELYSDIDMQFDAMMADSDLRANYYYNPDINTREIVGDNYSDLSERDYGNNDVEGPDAMHGTHVAGIVAADRNNDLGIKGICDNCLIMSVRTVPDGDERDKDVANAIYYAVDNGAKVINMSFGKGYSPQKEAVDKAVRYAEKNDVLMIHAAGNDSNNNDEVANFPNDTYKKGFGFLFFKKKSPKNWIEVGATTEYQDEKSVASFSNYGKREVDIFAPGLNMMSTVQDDNYIILQGTSMAAPVVAGVAGMIRSYFPDLKAKEVKSILMDSAVKFNKNVTVPGGSKVKTFSDLSVTGGVVNIYTAFKMASAKSKYSYSSKSKKDSNIKGDASQKVPNVEAGSM